LHSIEIRADEDDTLAKDKHSKHVHSSFSTEFIDDAETFKRCSIESSSIIGHGRTIGKLHEILPSLSSLFVIVSSNSAKMYASTIETLKKSFPDNLKFLVDYTL
jgi:hypothetical protein